MTNTLDFIITESDAAKMLSLSLQTMRRLRLDGGGPSFVKLTERRIGYLATDVRAWAQGRCFSSTSAATVAADGKAA